VPVLDHQALDAIRELAGDDMPELLASVARLYLDDAPRHLAAIDAAWSRRDAAALSVAAHTLKSASANLGAARLALLCKALELDARANDLSRVGALVAALGSAWVATRDELGAAVR
jgi:HPt (histidine-containing phosphotransfer) domain-containing protein